jgi:hypothetical protein
MDKLSTDLDASATSVPKHKVRSLDEIHGEGFVEGMRAAIRGDKPDAAKRQK